MHVALVAFDDFTDVDLFLPWDLLRRVPHPGAGGFTGDWRVSICAARPRVTSSTGLTVDAHAGLDATAQANAVFVISGTGSRAMIRDPAFLSALALDPTRQLIGAVDSGVLILAKLGLLDGLSATTYPSVFGDLEAMGIRTERRPLLVHGNLATAGGCLAGADLVGWMIERLISPQVAQRVLASIAKVVS